MSRAIIMGSGVGGLLTAKVLSSFYDEVCVLERDGNPLTSHNRAGVPQIKHTHVLLARGEQIIAGMFPEFAAMLEKEGAIRMNWGKEANIYPRGERVAPFKSDLTTHLCTRKLLEGTLRHLVHKIDNVSIRYQTDVKTIKLVDGVVSGVVISDEEESASLDGDLVVDARGRNSTIQHDLLSWGYGAPHTEIVDAAIVYATARVARSSPAVGENTVKQITVPPMSGNPRGGALCLIENGDWMVTLTGYGETYAPPADSSEFIAFTQQLASPILYETIKNHRLSTDVYRYMRPKNSWTHYEMMEKFPENLLIVGDAICTFNPIYGQGMTVAAMSAELLKQLLDDHAQSEAVSRFRLQIPQTIKVAWLYATGNDRKFTDYESPIYKRIPQMYINHLLKATTKSEYVAKTVCETMNFVRSPRSLFSPRMVISSIMN